MICLVIALFVIGFCIVAYNVESAQKDWLGILGYFLCVLSACLAGGYIF